MNYDLYAVPERLSEFFAIGRIDMVRGLEHLCIHALDQEKHHTPIAQTHLLLKLHQMFEPP